MVKEKRVLLINNAYPTECYPKRGNYIRAIELSMLKGNLIVDRLVMDSSYKNKILKLLHYLKFYLKLILCRDYQTYDYVYIHHFPYVFLPLIFHFRKMKSIVINFHGEDIIHTTFFSRIFNRISYQFLSRKFLYVVPSEYFKDKIIIQLPKLKDSIIFVAPSGGVDKSLFKPISNNSFSSKSKLIIGYASGFVFEKGIDDFVYLIKKLSPENHEFHLINYGRDKRKYITKVNKCKNVILHNVYEKEDMPHFYNSIDVLFFPTKSESLGLVALEAMSCCIPVIGPDDFELKNFIVNGVSGEKYNPEIKYSFIDAFYRFEINYGLYSPRKMVNKYSQEYAIDKFKEIFK